MGSLWTPKDPMPFDGRHRFSQLIKLGGNNGTSEAKLSSTFWFNLQTDIFITNLDVFIWCVHIGASHRMNETKSFYWHHPLAWSYGCMYSVSSYDEPKLTIDPIIKVFATILPWQMKALYLSSLSFKTPYNKAKSGINLLEWTSIS